MKIGYVVGAFGSVLCYKLHRKVLWNKLHKSICNRVYDYKFLEIIYLVLSMFIALGVNMINDNKYVDGFIAFLVIELIFKENLGNSKKPLEKKKYYNTLSSISNMFIESFIAPLMYIVFFGNAGGVMYFFISLICEEKAFTVSKIILNVFNIIPSLIGCGIFYVVYVMRNKSFRINFKGDFITNLIEKPMVNVYILAAYIESVNFYYYVEINGVHHIKSYGGYLGKINDISILDYESIIYGACFFIFVLFCIFISNCNPIF